MNYQLNPLVPTIPQWRDFVKTIDRSQNIYLDIMKKVSTEYENPKCNFWTVRKIYHWALWVATAAIISIMQKAHLSQQ